MIVGVMKDTFEIMSSSTLSKCIERYELDDNPNRYPRYMLLTSCKNDCGGLKNTSPSLDANTIVDALFKEETCDENGKEKWAMKNTTFPHCDKPKV